MIKIQDLGFSYNENSIFESVTYSFDTPGLHALTGPSGSGKTSFLSLLTGIKKPASGSINFDIPPRFSWVFQEPRLIPWKTLRENVLYIAPQLKKSELSGLFELFSLQDAMDKFPSEASGGMKSRVAIIRSLAHPANVYIWDEPFAGLDPAIKQMLLPILSKKIISLGASLFINLHEVQDALLLGTQLHEIKDKSILKKQ